MERIREYTGVYITPWGEEIPIFLEYPKYLTVVVS